MTKVFIIEFTKAGKLINQHGTPLVSFYKNLDNNSLNVLFSTAIYDSVQVFYSYNKIDYKRLHLDKSQSQPMLYVGLVSADRFLILKIVAFKDEEIYTFKDYIFTN